MALAVSATAAADTELDQLVNANGKWIAAEVASYRYVYQKYCVCYSGEPPAVVVTVTRGRVSDAFSRDAETGLETPAGDGRLDLYWTIDDLFEKLSAAMAREAIVTAEYDPELGYPTELFIDDFADFTGEETDLKLTGFEIL